jgi:16S rRNA (guanine966-N2)-methyltransferase
MRIIAGEFRGRKLDVPKGREVRPTADRVREAWMSILGPRLANARVLDLFSGSGALGLEALSRGAASVDFVERDADSLRALQQNIARLGVADRSTVRREDALRFAGRLSAGAYNVVVADPPYASDMVDQLVRLFRSVPFGDILSVEHSGNTTPAGDDSRRYGSTTLTFCYMP